MNAAPPAAAQPVILSARSLEQLGALQANMRRHAALRTAALRLLLTSRTAATGDAQREFWREFRGAERGYRLAVRSLARFCLLRREDSWRPTCGIAPHRQLRRS